MTRTTKGILALVTIAAVSTVGLAIAALNRGFSAKAEPLAIEAFVARHVRRLAIPAHARSAANLLPLTDDFVVDGMRHFADHCAVCHANDGSGDTDFGRNMYPKPPDLRLPPTQSLSDGELFYIIENGIRFTGMPACRACTARKCTNRSNFVRAPKALSNRAGAWVAPVRRASPASESALRTARPPIRPSLACAPDARGLAGRPWAPA